MNEIRIRDAVRGRGRVVAVLLCWSVLEAGQTFLFGFALARAMDEGFLRGRQGTGLWWLALAAAAVPVGAYGTSRVFGAVAGLVEPLRDRLVRRVVGRALRDAVGGDGQPADSAVVSRLTHQVEIARDSFGGIVMVLRSFLFTAAGTLAGMIALAPVLLLVVLPPLAAGTALFVLALRPLAKRQRSFLIADEAVAEECGALVGGLRDITACGAQQPMAERAGARVEAALRAARALARWGVLRTAALAVGGQLPVVLLLVASPWLLSSHRVTPGALLGAFAYLTQSLQPALQNLVHTLGVAGTRLGVVLARVAGGSGPAPAPPPARPAAAPAPGTVLDLRGVTFAYGPAAEPVLRDLDLAVRAGEHLAVVGPSGTGKSTLAGLVAGLLQPCEGEVRRACPVALVPQEAYVFRGTVAENIGYLREQTTPAGVGAAAAAVGAAALVDALGGPGGEVDPAALSAGERQLIALARTYLAPAGVVVLDEATCHLDPAAEEFAEAAFAARPGTTLVVIAHRISSARRADRTLVLDGADTACAPHAELLTGSPLYQDLAAAWVAT
ncbi:ATP-binding cassette domain-containing protein [Streptomyces sp. NPDC049040]|uniref:ATP-binding cassette domain-containing protein n=1 Tax=Streptomyces sp. NPDC049040 TaxID=3365593 RepID=UPI00371DD392